VQCRPRYSPRERAPWSPAPLSDPRHAHAWNGFLLRGQHTSPFLTSHAWQFAHLDAATEAAQVYIHQEGGSALAFKVDLAHTMEAWGPLDGGFGACPFLGEHAVELLGDRLAQAHRSHPDEINICGVDRGSSIERKLVPTLGRRYKLSWHHGFTTRAASLEGGLEGYLARRCARLCKNLRRESRRATKVGIRFERVRPSTPSGARTQLRRMLDIERDTWKAVKSANSITRERSLNAALLARLSMTQDARIIYARRGDEDVGFIFGGVAAGTYAGLHFCYREAWANYSIGNLLQVEKIRWLAEEGMERYDMGIAGEGRLAYKARWAERSTPFHIITLSRK
jgi:hypothetical protein